MPPPPPERRKSMWSGWRPSCRPSGEQQDDVQVDTTEREHGDQPGDVSPAEKESDHAKQSGGAHAERQAEERQERDARCAGHRSARRGATWSRSSRRAVWRAKFQLRQSSCSRRARCPSRPAATAHRAVASRRGYARSRTGTASALSDAAYQPSKGRSTGGRARLVRTIRASGFTRCSAPSTANPRTRAPKAKRRRCPRSAVQPNHAATPARYSMKAVEYRRISESPYALTYSRMRSRADAMTTATSRSRTR